MCVCMVAGRFRPIHGAQHILATCLAYRLITGCSRTAWRKATGNQHGRIRMREVMFVLRRRGKKRRGRLGDLLETNSLLQGDLRSSAPPTHPVQMDSRSRSIRIIEQAQKSLLGVLCIQGPIRTKHTVPTFLGGWMDIRDNVLDACRANPPYF